MIELQTAILDKLKASTELTDLLPDFDYGDGFIEPSIFDHVPQVIDSSDDSYFPYVRIESPIDNNNDTDTENAFDTTFQIHVWSRYLGNTETAQVQKAIYDALHRQAITVTGYGATTPHQEYSEIMLEPDGITRHGIQRFRIYYEPTS